jgi:site-specific DNA recombinase
MAATTIAKTLDQVLKNLEMQALEKGLEHRIQPKSLQDKGAIQKEIETLYEKDMREIDLLSEGYSKSINHKTADSIGLLYARQSSFKQDSIVDQVRTILEEAIRKKVFISRENIFFDIAYPGMTERRPGLLALREKIKSGKIKTLMVFTTSRLFRSTYKALQFVEEELVEQDIRGLFVKSHIDTANTGEWRTLFQALASNDEAQVRLYGAHIQAAHEGLFERRMVHTSLSLGYTGEVVDGEHTKRFRPRRRIVVDVLAAQWIVKIFYWYVVDGIGISKIARMLNADPYAPAPAKSTTGLWTHALVVKHLKNAQYRGYSTYGVRKTKWLSKKDYAAQVLRESPLKEKQDEELRIIPDDCWYAAQTLLASEPNRGGRKPNHESDKRPTNLLQGLFVCPTHDRRVAAGGANGVVLLCPLCRSIKSDERPLFTHLNRSLALRLTFQYLIDQLNPTDDLVKSVIDVCARESESLSESNPEVVQILQNQLKVWDSKIDFNRRNPGISADEQRRTELVLKDLHNERNELTARLRSVETAIKVLDRIPDREAIVRFLDSTSDLLRQCLNSSDETVLRKGRRIIDILTGGRILLQQIGERAKSKGHLQGRFQIDTVAYVVEGLTGMRLCESNSVYEAVIDFQQPLVVEDQSETAKRLWDDGLLLVDIAKQMGYTPPYITKLIQCWHDKGGLSRPNNYQRRKQLENKQSKMPIYKIIANEVVAFMKIGLSNSEIRRRLKTSDPTVAKAITWWHEMQGLPVPTTADRRLKKLECAMAMLDGGALLTDVAAEVGYCAPGLKSALNKYAIDNGGKSLDFRTRRGNAKSGGRANGKTSASESRAA